MGGGSWSLEGRPVGDQSHAPLESLPGSELRLGPRECPWPPVHPEAAHSAPPFTVQGTFSEHLSRLKLAPNNFLLPLTLAPNPRPI